MSSIFGMWRVGRRPFITEHSIEGWKHCSRIQSNCSSLQEQCKLWELTLVLEYVTCSRTSLLAWARTFRILMCLQKRSSDYDFAGVGFWSRERWYVVSKMAVESAVRILRLIADRILRLIRSDQEWTISHSAVEHRRKNYRFLMCYRMFLSLQLLGDGHCSTVS